MMGMRWRGGFTREEFISAWRSASTVSDVAGQFGITTLRASHLATRLRSEGVALKRGHRGLLGSTRAPIRHTWRERDDVLPPDELRRRRIREAAREEARQLFRSHPALSGSTGSGSG